MASVRHSLVVIHRYVGLGLAVFLFLAGITGAIIAWEREVDHFINPQIFKSNTGPEAQGLMDTFTLVDAVEKQNPELVVGYFPLEYTPGNTAIMYVHAKGEEDVKEYQAGELGYNEIFVDPVTVEIQGRRQWGEFSWEREYWLPWIYRFHYSLKLEDFGLWFMGILAIVWVIDCFVALVISFPSRRQWKKSFAFNFRHSLGRTLFDLHRSGGVWMWPLLLVIAITSIWMNLPSQFESVVYMFSSKRETGFDWTNKPPERIKPTLTRREVVDAARVQATKLGIEDPPGALSYNDDFGTYSVGFFESEEDQAGHGSFGWQPPWLTIDGRTGELKGYDIPGTGSWGDRFVDLQFPLHSGRLIGTPGKAIVSILGVIVAMLSVTGVWLWARRHVAARRRAAANEAKGQTPSANSAT